jgi:hypothetical protein
VFENHQLKLEYYIYNNFDLLKISNWYDTNFYFFETAFIIVFQNHYLQNSKDKRAIPTFDFFVFIVFSLN